MSQGIEQRVRAVVGKVAKKSDSANFAADADLFRTLGVESTAALDLLLSLEEEFNVQIPDEKFGEARTVRSLATLIEQLSSETKSEQQS